MKVLVNNLVVLFQYSLSLIPQYICSSFPNKHKQTCLSIVVCQQQQPYICIILYFNLINAHKYQNT